MSHLAIISLDATIAVTKYSRRTWWRRMDQGVVTKLPVDSRGRAMLMLKDVIKELVMPLDDESLKLLVKADSGDAQAQAEIGALFALEHQKAGLVTGSDFIVPALYWLELAAEQGQADAMHWMGILYAGGYGGEKSQNLALMWIARSAAHDHLIAQTQLSQLLMRLPTYGLRREP